MTKEKQYTEYKKWGGTMTIEEWEMDGRYDRYTPIEDSEVKKIIPKMEVDYFYLQHLSYGFLGDFLEYRSDQAKKFGITEKEYELRQIELWQIAMKERKKDL